MRKKEVRKKEERESEREGETTGTVQTTPGSLSKIVTSNIAILSCLKTTFSLPRLSIPLPCHDQRFPKSRLKSLEANQCGYDFEVIQKSTG